MNVELTEQKAAKQPSLKNGKRAIPKLQRSFGNMKCSIETRDKQWQRIPLQRTVPDNDWRRDKKHELIK
jgi:hypothetical protein